MKKVKVKAIPKPRIKHLFRKPSSFVRGPAYVRMNSRVEQSQQDFVKKYAMEHALTEGEVARLIIKKFIDNQ